MSNFFSKKKTYIIKLIELLNDYTFAILICCKYKKLYLEGSKCIVSLNSWNDLDTQERRTLPNYSLVTMSRLV